MCLGTAEIRKCTTVFQDAGFRHDNVIELGPENSSLLNCSYAEQQVTATVLFERTESNLSFASEQVRGTKQGGLVQLLGSNRTRYIQHRSGISGRVHF